MPSIELKYTFDSEDELRAHLGGEQRAATPATVAPTTPVVPAEPADDNVAPEVDADGMPWNEEIHSGGKAVNADGRWKAKQGKAEEAKAARSAFLAGGANEEAPTDLPDVTETTPTSPGLPGMEALPTDAPAPVTLERFMDKVQGMMTRGTFDAEAWKAANAEQGITDPNAELAVNETARAAVYAKLCEIEPDLS